jgi:hypothetical protein
MPSFFKFDLFLHWVGQGDTPPHNGGGHRGRGLPQRSAYVKVRDVGHRRNLIKNSTINE